MKFCFGENLKELRTNRNLTQENLADYFGVSFQTISKWERGDSCPDISILPEIAIFFDVSIDDLLGVDNVKSEQKINEYLDLYESERSKNRPITLEKFQNAVKEFPNDFRILIRYMELLFEEKDSIIMSDYEKTSQKIFAIYEKIQNHCTDDSIRIWSKRIMCKHIMNNYSCLGYDEKYLNLAKDILNTMPSMSDSREIMSLEVYHNDKKKWYSNQENVIEELLYLLQTTIISYCYYDDKFSPKYKINVIEHINELFKIVDNYDNYSKNRIHIIYNYGHLGRLYYQVGDIENAIKNLMASAKCAKNLDEHSDIEERIATFYETEERFLNMTMCERMTELMTNHYGLPQDFISSSEFQEILNFMK
jgi:transcriptional regulator with XRE-family HTH domain